MEQKPLPNEWPQHIRKDMETFLHMYPDATPDMIKRHAHAMDELTPDAEKSAQTPLPPIVSDEEARAIILNEGCSDGFWALRELCESRSLKTREVVQALVDALVSAERYMTETGSRTGPGCLCHCPVIDGHTGKCPIPPALALTKSTLNIEPSKP